jgi:hypothetical protein
VALLAAVTAHFEDGHAVDADLDKRIFHGFELRGLDDGFDFSHVALLAYPFHNVITAPPVTMSDPPTRIGRVGVCWKRTRASTCATRKKSTT